MTKAKRTIVSAPELDMAYDNAIARAGEHPNALGFMRRVEGSKYFRSAPNGRRDMPSIPELVKAYHECVLAARVGRW